MLVKYYIYLSRRLVRCYICIIVNLSSWVFLYFHFCCPNVTGLLVNPNQLSQYSRVPPALSFFLVEVIQLLLHISHYASVLGTKCLNAFSCISPHLRFLSVNRSSTTQVILSLLYLPACTVIFSCDCVCCMRLGKTDLPLFKREYRLSFKKNVSI